MSNSAKAYIFTSIAIFFWATSATAFKIALQDFNPFNVLFYSTISSTFILGLIVIFQRKTRLFLKLNITSIRNILISGTLNPFLYYTVLFSAYNILPGQIAMSLNYIWPIILILMAIPVLKHKLRRKDILAVLISFSGAVIIALQGNFSFDLSRINIWGVSLALISTVIWATYWLLNTKDQLDPVFKLFCSFIWGTFLITILQVITGNLKAPESFNFITLIYIGFFEMGFTFMIWLFALKNARDTAQIGNLIYITPFLSLLFLHLVIGETIYNTTFAGLALIIGGVIIQKVSISPKKQPDII